MTRKRTGLLILLTLLSVIFLTGCGDKSNTISNENFKASSHVRSDYLKVAFLDVGQGDSIFIELPNNQTMLIDAGNPENGTDVSKYIQDAGYSRIDYVVATHPHDDHIGGLPEIIKTFDVGSIYMPKVSNNTSVFENLLTEIDHKGYQITEAKAGVTILNDGDLNIDIVAPVESSYKDLNNYSAVIKLDYGSTSFLFTGDAEKLSENEITADLNADVLKVGHHGSEYSSGPSFIEKVSPNYAVISVGKGNLYGHPSNETLKTLSAAGVTTFRTDYDSTIVFTSDGSEITVEQASSGNSVLTPSAANAGDIAVYVTASGSKYHKEGCPYLSKSKIPIALSDARLKYDPCSKCNPPL